MCRISYVDKDRISIIILKTCSQLYRRIISVTIHHITQHSPRKPLKIWAAFCDSPGRLNECIRLEPPCVAMVCPSCSETSAAIQKRWNLIVWKAILEGTTCYNAGMPFQPPRFEALGRQQTLRLYEKQTTYLEGGLGLVHEVAKLALHLYSALRIISIRLRGIRGVVMRKAHEISMND